MEDAVDNKFYYDVLTDFLKDNKAIWQVTIVSTDGSSPARAGMKMLIPASGDVYGNLGGGELEHNLIAYVRCEKPSLAQSISYDLNSTEASQFVPTAMLCGGTATVFIEPLHLPQQLFIIGAGHCGKALGRLAKLCGFYVHLVDNRPESLAGDISEYGHKACFSDFEDISSALCFGPDSWIVIMTHGHVHDKRVLEQCLRRSSRYLGMIGSKHKVAETFAQLREQGFGEAELALVHAPIGLRIGSQSPYEIAVSIMAEIIKELRLG